NNNANTTYSGVLSGFGGLTKIGSSTLTLAGQNSFAGPTQINQGTLQLAAADRLPSASNLILNGGTFATAGFNQTLGTLNVSSSSILDLGNGASVLRFAASDALSWSGTLSIANWDGNRAVGNGPDQILFGNSATALTSGELSDIQFAGYPLGASILSNGEIVPAAAPLPVPGDLNRDAHVTAADISEMMQALANLNTFQSTNELSAADLSTIADVNHDGQINNADVQALIGLVATQATTSGAGSLTTVPEPSAIVLFWIAAVTLPLVKFAAYRATAAPPSAMASASIARAAIRAKRVPPLTT
ncbi:MAG TPA: autotransporter-associated beta strand repeat-containing protein, partial [Pirellulales bacterium]